MSDSTLYKLVNPEFDFEFDGTLYHIRKANLDKAVQYQNKIGELKNDPAADAKVISYCIYLMLKDKIADLTPEIVLEKTPADIDILECLTTLGFIAPKRLEMARKINETLEKKLITESSS